MEHLWPRISSGGALLIDDYGHFMGAKKAVDEYIAEHRLPVLLNRIDFTGRLVVKPHAGHSAASPMARAHPADIDSQENDREIGRDVRRERVWQYEYIQVGAVKLK